MAGGHRAALGGGVRKNPPPIVTVGRSGGDSRGLGPLTSLPQNLVEDRFWERIRTEGAQRKQKKVSTFPARFGNFPWEKWPKRAEEGKN